MAKKILILLGKIDWLGKTMKQTGLVDVDTVYHPVSYFKKRLRTLDYHTSRSKVHWYNSWKDQLNQYAVIILFDSFLGSDVAEYIEENAPHIRLIVFYFNPWFNNYYLSDEARKKCEIWSFDKKDCKKYNLKYNHQFYFYSLQNQGIDDTYSSDLFFIGNDKGRLHQLMKLNKMLEESHLQPLFYVVPDKHIKYNNIEKNFLRREGMPYEAVLKYVKNTNCLLEIVQQHQEGLTLRMMEAMFFNKKIITNNKEVQEYDFYDEKNIYIIDNDSRNITEFITKRVETMWNRNTVQKYSFENWLSNFFV